MGIRYFQTDERWERRGEEAWVKARREDSRSVWHGHPPEGVRPWHPLRRMRCVALLACAIVCGGLWGCYTSRNDVVGLPAKHSVESEQLLVLSDHKFGREHKLIRDLERVRADVAETLGLPMHGRKVVVYVFRDQEKYARYMSARYPGLPPRRAYFVGTPQELGVYTFWGERIQEDLRHEFTHGLLHSALKSVPLWLDEGIAEYFEVVGRNSGQVNVDYTTRMSKAIVNGWRPDMKRLEQMTEVAQMQRSDYQESWAWIHFLLHSSFETRGVLLEYLDELRTNPNPGHLSDDVFREQPHVDARFLNYVVSLQTGRYLASGEAWSRHATREGAIELDYVPVLPSDLGSRVVLTRFDGTKGIADARQTYAHAHRLGWSACRDLFIAGRLDVTDATLVAGHLKRQEADDWTLAVDAREAGFRQCRSQLQHLIRRSGAKNVREALASRALAREDESSGVLARESPAR